MPNFRAITYLDTLPAMIGLWKKRGDFAAGFDDADPRKTIEVRGARNADEPETYADMPVLEDWKGLRSLLAKAQRGIGVQPLGAASVEMLPSRTAVPWMAETEAHARRFDRFVLALATNPGCLTYCGNEVVHMPVGHLYWMAAGVLHSAVNFGEHPRYHLIFDVLKPDA